MTKGERSHPLCGTGEDPLLAAAGDVPNPDGFVLTPGGRQEVVQTKSNSSYGAGMTAREYSIRSLRARGFG